jgi:hypothetical protein
MQQETALIKDRFPDLKVEYNERKILIAEGTADASFISISNIKGNQELELIIRDEGDVKELLALPLNELYFFRDYLGYFHDKEVQVILRDVSFRTIFIIEDRLEKSPIEISLNYKKKNLKLNIQFKKDTPLKFIAKHIKGSRGYSLHRAITISIENLSDIKLEELESEVRLILNSVLFDIEYNFNLAFELISINSLLRKIRRRPKAKYDIPLSTIELTYKKYIPELIDYFHTAEKVDYLPFKYICYFHTIEYFQDKSAYFIVREKLKQIIQKPDFSLNINNYASQALNLIKQESEKHQTDKVKIQRVFKQFVDITELKSYLEEIGLLDYFLNECTMQFSKSLVLPALDFSSEVKLIETLTNRIYSMRCSIVHSNPDFDDKKGVPFLATIENIDKLRYEIELIMEISKSIILKSA